VFGYTHVYGDDSFDLSGIAGNGYSDEDYVYKLIRYSYHDNFNEKGNYF
jgi:hypothetical protein